MRYPEEIPPEMCDRFIELSRAVRKKKPRSGAMFILNKMRWDDTVEGTGEFKCPNQWAPILARWAMKNFPELNGFFETRPSKEDGRF